MNWYRKSQAGEEYFLDVYEYVEPNVDEYGGFESVKTLSFDSLKKAQDASKDWAENDNQIVVVSDVTGDLFVGVFESGSYREYPGIKQWTDSTFKLYSVDSSEGKDLIERVYHREPGPVSPDLEREMEERSLEEAAMMGDKEPERPEY